MNKKTFSIAVTLVFSALVCFAIVADLAGKWTGQITAPDGTIFDLTYNFKIDGDKLSGSVATAQGELPITDGKITGNDFTFKLDFNGTTIDNVGKYYGDSVIVDASVSGTKLHSKLLRAK